MKIKEPEFVFLIGTGYVKNPRYNREVNIDGWSLPGKIYLPPQSEREARAAEISALKLDRFPRSWWAEFLHWWKT